MDENELKITAEMLMDIAVLSAMTMLSGLSAYFLFMLSGFDLEVSAWYSIVTTTFFGLYSGISIRKSVERHRTVLEVEE